MRKLLAILLCLIPAAAQAQFQTTQLEGQGFAKSNQVCYTNKPNIFLQSNTMSKTLFFNFLGGGGNATSNINFDNDFVINGAASGVLFSSSGSTRFYIFENGGGNNGSFMAGAAGGLGWSSGTPGTNAFDTGLSRDSAGVIDIGNGTQADISGTIQAAIENLGKASSATGKINFNGTTSGTVTLSTADAAGTWTMKLPTTAGTANYFLQTDGSGNTTWATGSASGVTSITGDGTITNNSASTGAVTLTLATQTPNTVLAGPTSGSTHLAPTFRNSVAADFGAAFADTTVLANASGGTAGVTFTTLSTLFADAFGGSTGELIYLNASAQWAGLPPPASANLPLLSGGAGNNPSWAKLPNADIAPIATNTVLGNVSGGSASPLALTISTGLTGASTAISSNAVYFLDYQPGPLGAINSSFGAFYKVSKAATVDNITGSTITYTCASAPTITMYECGSSTTCASSPTTIGSVQLTGAGAAFTGTVSNSAITAGDWVAFAISAGTCASSDINVNAQVHSN